MFKKYLYKAVMLLAVFSLTISAMGMNTTSARAAGIIYVNTNASGANDGSSWGNAYLTLQDALAAAASGDQIWVAAGVYYPDAGVGQTNNSRSSTFTLINGVQIYGGFAGTEALLSERNISANITILSGDLEQNDTNADADFTAETTGDIVGNNAYHVVRGGDATATTILDGFTITAGNADGPTFDTQNGGGLFNWGTNPTVQNVIFSGNNAEETNFGYGGGVYNYIVTSPAQFTNIVFTGNNAHAGGGMAGDPDIVINNSTFINNTASNIGGALEISGNGGSLTNVTFTNNTAAGGGALNITVGNLTLTNVTFSNNTAESAGAVNVYQSNPEFINVTFDNNTASDFYGGAVQLAQSAPIFRNVTFSNNSANISGGAIFSSTSSDPTLANVTFANNSAVNQGGGFYTGGSSDATLTNVTFSNNNAGLTGGGIYALSGTITLQNTIIANSTDGGDCFGDSATINGAGHNLIESTGGDACNLVNGVNGNIIGSDPNLGLLTGSPAYFPLNTGSPAIDAGDNATCAAAPVNNTSQNGITRPAGSLCDIGSSEAGANINVTIGGASQGTYTLAPGESSRQNYPTVDAGPVKIESTNGVPIIAALREAWDNQGTGLLSSTSFAQLMGIPAEQLSDTYYLPHYNDLSPLLDAQLRIGNIDTTTATVAITIGGVLQETVNIAPGASYRVNYPTLDAGPVKVESTDNKKIVVALREAWNNQQTGLLSSTSFTQLMGIPAEQLSDTYYLPHYNDLSPLLDAQLRIGNVDTTTATVAITIGGVLQETVNIAPGASYRVNYPTLDAGPVKVESTDNKKIVVALREAWNNQQTGLLASTSFAQVMGIPAEKLSDTYLLPHYNDLSPLLDAQLRIGNVDTTTATVAITIGGVLQETVNIAPGASYRVNYPTLDAGPVKVESTDNKKIVVALREAWNNQGTGLLSSTSFTQLMGLPLEDLSAIYYLPHYNDLSPLLDAQLRFGVP